jgi:hypothetical protein
MNSLKAKLDAAKEAVKGVGPQPEKQHGTVAGEIYRSNQAPAKPGKTNAAIYQHFAEDGAQKVREVREQQALRARKTR